MDFNFPLLEADQIEVKVKQVTSTGAIMLLYKTARTDMELLDAVVGPMNWADDYKEIKGNLYCGIGITDGENWVWKWDCGIESRADGDGNEKKGEASDAFKRAGFRWGIGRELYTGPFIFAKIKTVPRDGGRGYELEDRYARFSVDEIGYDGKTINKLVIVDNNGKVVYTYGTRRPQTTGRQTAKEVGDQKLKDIENKLGELNGDTSPTPTKGEIQMCDRCGKPITGWVAPDGGRFTASALIKRAQEKYNGCYCAACMTALNDERNKRKAG